ncbi:MAG: CAP domain-containing protein [Planctomycetes bacterium]|nr:CAP domain-containing protein [Planctomycetota bacterium]
MARILTMVVLLATAAASAAPDPEREFLRLLSSAKTTPRERRAAFEALRKGGGAPSGQAVREIRSAWEDALRDLARASTTRPVFAEAQKAIPSLAQIGDRMRRIVAADKVPRERLDEALQDAVKTIDEVRAKIEGAPEREAAAERLLEVGAYAAWAGVLRGFTDSVGEVLIELAFLRNFAAPKDAPVLDFNDTMAAAIDAGEAECIARTNIHRIRLGLRPLEIDLRLVAAARKHSEEMARLDYFSHDSPTPEVRTVWMRANREGVAAAMENIAMAGSPAEAFSMWFYSPGHHRNMIGTGLASIGVGESGGRWTMVGGRLSLIRVYRKIKALAYVRMRYEAGEDVGKVFDLARSCLAQGLVAQAEDELERVLRLEPDHAEARDLLAKLRAAAKKG